jgi:hypothetical protein
MAEIVPFARKYVHTAERGRPAPHQASDLLAVSIGLGSITVSLRSAPGHGKAIIQQLERYKESLTI